MPSVNPPPTMNTNRQQRRFLRGVVYTLVFISTTTSTFFFVRMLYRGYKADLRARHANVHAGLTEADVRKEFGLPTYESEFPHRWVGERELGRPLPPGGVQIKSWSVGRDRTFCVSLSGDGEVLKVSSTCPEDRRTWIERRIDDLLE